MNSNQYFNSFLSYETFLKTQTSLFFSIVSLNVRSISSISKFNKFKTIITQFSKLPDIICIQETWFESTLIQLYNIPGYNSVHCCRSDGYGGTSVFIRKNILYTVESSESKDFIESIILTIESQKVSGKPIKLISLYRSQKCNFKTFSDYIENQLYLLAQSPCILVGDTNVDFLMNPLANVLSDLFSSYDFKNCHTLVTRPCSGTSIDNVFSNIHTSLYIESIESNLSDHNLIAIRLDSQSQRQDFTEIVRYYCNYDQVKRKLNNNLSLSNLTGDPNNDTKFFINVVTNAVSSSTLITKKRIPLKHEITPWINGNLQALIEYKKKLLKARRRQRYKGDIEISLKRISKVIKVAMKECMMKYYHENLYKIQTEPRKCWQFLNQTLGRNSKSKNCLRNDNGDVIHNDAEKAEIFNLYFLNSVKNLNRQIEYNSNDHCNLLRTLRYTSRQFSLNYTTSNEVSDFIADLQLNKSAGSDCISSRCMLECKEIVAPLLSKIFNFAIYSSTYPDILKIHKVIPIPKEINCTSIDKFRPVAVLSVIDKIFEKILHEQLLSYLEEENLLYPNQYGFRKGCGTDEAVINVINYICGGLDRGYTSVGGIFYDFTKAFDLVDHSIMIQKLEFYGVRGQELNLFKSYLENRRQYVQCYKSRSSMGNVEFGVPQGSVLGPLFFNIYLNDINNLGLNGKIFMYADDLCILYPYKEHLVFKTFAERDAALITEYARLNKLVLNPNKTKLLRFRPQPNRDQYRNTILIDGKEIAEVETIKYLGIILQNNLSWQQQIQHVRSIISPALGILYKLKYKLDEKTKYIIFQALVHSHLNYLTLIYGFRKNAELKSLQIIQNKSLKTVFNLPQLFPTLTLYKDVVKTVLPIYGIYKMQLLIYVYKVVHGIGHHTTSFPRNQIVFNTRNNSNLRLARCRLETTKQRIEFIGSLEYNNLPNFLKDSLTISTFKQRLKEYFLQNIEMLLI